MSATRDPSALSRRGFLAGAGALSGALVLGWRGGRVVAAGPPAASPTPATELVVAPFLHIASDGAVTIACARSEMGQGVRSSLPALIADELGANLSRVTVVQADGDERYGDQNTDGSASVRLGEDERLRRIGAAARMMLTQAAAARWKAPAARLTARDHYLYDPKRGLRLGFDELVADAARLPVPDSRTLSLRPARELAYMGRALPLVDGPAFVTGQARFGADIRLPGMLTAVIARPPVVGGKVAHYDARAALATAGVKQVVELPALTGAPGFQPLGGVAVIAEHTWAALRGRAALTIAWDHGDNADYDSDAYAAELLAAVRAPGRVVRSVGDVDAALRSAARTVEAEYLVPHQAHVPMEPPVAVARFDGTRCELWVPTQAPIDVRDEVAGALGLAPDAVTVHVTFLGGAFGRKAKPDYAVEAALLSRAAKAPVRVQWSREDDVKHGYYHTASAQRLSAGIGADGKLTAWLHRTAFPSISATFKQGVDGPSDGELAQGLTDLPLAVPAVRAEAGKARAHVRIGWLRSVCNIHHGFAVGSFVDELASALGRDPRDMLLEVLGPARSLTPAEAGVASLRNYGAPAGQHPIDVGRLRHVIDRASSLADWDKARAGGRALGIAAHRSFLSYVAVVAAASRDAAGRPTIDEVWIAADAGRIVNLDRVRAQLEGAVVFGLSLAFHGAITARAGAIEQSNFRDYRLLRMPAAPRIHVEVVTSDKPPGGVGEPGVPPVAPAAMNALFALTGERVRALPVHRQPPT